MLVKNKKSKNLQYVGKIYINNDMTKEKISNRKE